MSDQERKGKSGEDDREHSEETKAPEAETSEQAADETDTDETDKKDEKDDETDGEQQDGDEDEDEEEAEAGEDEESARAQRVAAALGVGAETEPGEGTAAEDEPAAVPNRAARRAEAAQRRKNRKTASANSERSAVDDAADGPLPRDKNARAKELLKRRREQAAGEGSRPIQLLPGEMVDDALARSSSAVSKWIRDNFSILQWVILATVASGIGYLVYQTRADKSAAGATAELMVGVDADRGRVMAEDKRSADEKESDPTKVFKTSDERADTALASYKKVLVDHAGTGAAILARLGEAGDYLDKRDFDHALEGFSAVSASTLAGADPDVKVRALEGIGFAREGKGDLDGALTAFKEIEDVDDGRHGNKELGLYHQGRVWLAKGDKDKAKDFLKKAHDKLEQPTPESQAFHYLQQMTDETLRRIDPSLVPAKAPAIGGAKGGAMTADEIEKLKRKFEETMKNKGEQH